MRAESAFSLAVLGVLFPVAGFAQPFDPAYQVELTRGPVVAPTRITGMGGAFVSIAEGAGAYELNPASAAIRERHNKDDQWDWDFSLEAIVAATDNDFENNRLDLIENDLAVGSTALGFVAHEFGFGVSFAVTSIELQREDVTTELAAGTLSLVTAYNFMDGQLVMGGSLALGAATATVDGVELMNLGGAGFTLGGVARPKNESYRFGFTFRSRTRLSPREVEPGTRVGIVVVPTAVVLPAQLTVGMSYSVGARAKNFTGTFGKRDARPDEILPESREIATVAMDLVFTERLKQTAGFQAWTGDALQVAGEEISIGFHLGVETELIEHWLKWRIGTYFEPSRFESVGRIHATTGVDLKMFHLVWDWKAAAAVDLSRRYSNLILSIGFWH